MKVRSMIGALLLLAVTACTALAQRSRKSTDVEPPPLEKILANAKSPTDEHLADLTAIKPALPLGPVDVLKGYEQGMALIAQGMSADFVNISRAQETNQITRERAEYLIEERYQIAMMQYEVLSALHDALEHDVAQEATRAKRTLGELGTAVVVELPSLGSSAQVK